MAILSKLCLYVTLARSFFVTRVRDFFEFSCSSHFFTSHDVLSAHFFPTTVRFLRGRAPVAISTALMLCMSLMGNKLLTYLPACL